LRLNLGIFPKLSLYLSQSLLSAAPSINPAPEVNIVPALNPTPEVNPAPAITIAPEVNPVPEVNPSPSITPAQSDISPAELNPSPYIVHPLVPEISPQQVPVPADLSTTGNFSIWLNVFSTPLKFQITILNDDENLPYTGIQNGPCMPALQYWQNETLGCPCNGIWINDGILDESGSTSVGGRVIIPAQCPSSSCPEAFFINDTVKYGKVRLNVTVFENGTIINKTLEITKMSTIKEIGYAFGAADVVYLFRAGKNYNGPVVDIPEALNPSPEAEQNPAPYITTPGVEPDAVEQGSSGSTLPLATTITTIFVFLLMMYENTQ